MMRYESTSIITSLQMDYGGDSDEEDTDKRNTSKGSEIGDETGPQGSEASNTEDVKPTIKDSLTPPDDREIQVMLEDDDMDIVHSDDEEDIKPDDGLISDDEVNERRSHPQIDVEVDIKPFIADARKTDSPSSQGSTQPGRKATRLVSYGPDEGGDEDEDEDSSLSEEDEKSIKDGLIPSSDIRVLDTSSLSRIVQNMEQSDIKIPPEPIGKCSIQLQKKIEDMVNRMTEHGLDLNRSIQSKKNFRNPSIYEKLIEFCHIDEKGTNFPPEIYDPHIWGKESYYDELDKVQRKEMERREKEKKAKVEFIMGTKKQSSGAGAASDSSSGQPDEKKRKSKWDTQPSSVIQVSKVSSASGNPGVVNLTAVATGTKATVIPAVGSLSKKSSSGK